MYHGLALVRRGDVTDGIAYALAAVTALPTPVRTVGVAVADLIRAVPAVYTSTDLDELRRHAARDGLPWVASRV